MSSYIEIRNVVKSFGNNTVLKHINLDVNEGEMVTLLGPSGCGKSTLLRAIAGLNDVDEGSVFIDGKDVTRSARLFSARWAWYSRATPCSPT